MASKSAPIQPLALYGAVEGALASGFVAAELHHLWGSREGRVANHVSDSHAPPCRDVMFWE
ncbi:MAG: hypothetical protein EOR69_32115 [Mesorhizobium sp.]|nr:MAG: hypothetical protein EOR69_32115 [Mesorhizobium sp.]RWL92864.1 MAG: hypothetical protein EOR70_30200 [Mesorhizobium sp.]